jgi:hypothetical protein
MALKVLHEGQRSSLFAASATCFTKANYGNNTNTTISINTPRGVLGGSVAAVSAGADYTVYPCDKDLTPLGLFMNDAAGAAFDNASAVASGKITVVKYASVEVDVYETRNAADNADLTYACGNKLYSSVYGLLTNEASTSAIVIGYVTKVPSATSPTLGLNLAI